MPVCLPACALSLSGWSILGIHLTRRWYPDVWSKRSSCDAVKVFLDGINIFISICGVKQFTFYNMDELYSTSQLKTFRENRDPPKKMEFCLQSTLGFQLHISSSLSFQPAGPPCKFWTWQPPIMVGDCSLKYFFSLFTYICRYR